MTVRIGKHNVQVVTAPHGVLVVLIDGRPLRNRSFIFLNDAVQAAEQAIEDAVK
jgi:hypothetical protein